MVQLTRPKRAARRVSPPFCPYCGDPSKPASGVQVYPKRPDLAHKRFFICEPCGAWVGTNANSGEPLGRLANAELRRAKRAAHAAFDPVWKEMAKNEGIRRGRARSRAYGWLAAQLGIPPAYCHIGKFDLEECRRVVEVCESAWPSVGVRDGVPPRRPSEI